MRTSRCGLNSKPRNELQAMPVKPSTRTVLADWFRGHSTPLTTLDPQQPLDDLEGLPGHHR